jgi:hypothetical protein
MTVNLKTFEESLPGLLRDFDVGSDAAACIDQLKAEGRLEKIIGAHDGDEPVRDEDDAGAAFENLAAYDPVLLFAESEAEASKADDGDAKTRREAWWNGVAQRRLRRLYRESGSHRLEFERDEDGEEYVAKVVWLKR